MRIQLIVLLALVPCVGRADAPMSAKDHYKKGISFYALQKFSEAAAEYEAAFELAPDPALLYNAAQAHRLAGNKQRALALYQSFQRMFPEKDDGTVSRHIAALKTAIEAEGKAQTNPPTSPRSVDVKQDTPPPKAPPPPVIQVVQQQPPPPPKKSTPKWVWGVVGGVVAAVGIGLGVGLGVGLSGTTYPSASYSGRVP
jgi:tetratricopeptide (TPR) repeat protein